MSFIAAASLIAGGSVIAGGLGAAASIYGSQQQVSEENKALALQQQQLQQLTPYENVGAGATYSLGQLYGIGPNGQPTNQPINYSQFTNSPDYQFAFQQGSAALQNQLNASGLAGSGAGEAAAVQFGQGLATQQYSNYFNRLLSLSGMGESAASAGVGGANAAAQTLGSIGQSQASGTIGAANSLTGGINSGISNALLYSAIRGNPSGYVSASGANPAAFTTGTAPVPYVTAPNAGLSYS